MKLYLLNLKFAIKAVFFIAFVGTFFFLNALIPIIPIPERFNVHSAINKISFWYFDVEKCRQKNKKS